MSRKFKNLLTLFIIFQALFLLIVSISLAEILPLDDAILLIALSSIIFIMGVVVAIGIDYSSTVYKCKKCGHHFKPSFIAYLLGAHTLTTRYLKCPQCEEKSWCKITEEMQ